MTQLRARVVVVEDHALVRDSVARSLEVAGLEVVGATGDPDEALTLARLHLPELLLVDVDLGATKDGLDVVADARGVVPGLKVVVVSMHDDDRTIRRALGLRVEGFVTKDAPLTELLAAVETVQDGGSFLSARLAGRVMAMIGGQMAAGHGHDDGTHLTEREREVLALLADGERPTEIAAALFMAPKTVKNHLTSVYAKLGVATAAQAVAEAYRLGIAHGNEARNDHGGPGHRS